MIQEVSNISLSLLKFIGFMDSQGVFSNSSIWGHLDQRYCQL